MSSNTSSPIALIVPMEEEARSLIERYFPDRPVPCIGSDVFEASVGGLQVVLVRCGIGKVNAASAAAAVIMGWSPSALVVSGVAGALGGDLQTGDIVVATGALDHHLDLTPLIKGPGRLPGMASPVIPASSVLAGKLARAAEAVASRSAWPSRRPPTVHRGVFATGDALVNSISAKEGIVARFPDASAVDMETAAVAQVAASASLPWACARVISDMADETFDPREVLGYASDEAAGVIAELLGELALEPWVGHN